MSSSRIAKRVVLPAALAAIGFGSALADEQVWDDPVGDNTGGSWFDSKWDINGTWSNDPLVPNSAFFWRPGTDAPVQTRVITVPSTVYAATLTLQHGVSGEVKHVHHFTGSGPLNLQTRLMEDGLPAVGPGDEPLYGPGVIRPIGHNNAQYGDVIFDVPIHAPSGLLITYLVPGNVNSDSRGRGSTVVLNAANTIGGEVLFQGRGPAESTTNPTAADLSRLVLSHPNALGADPDPEDTSVHLRVQQANPSASSHGPTVVLTNNITVAHNIRFEDSVGRLHSIGDNKLTGRLDMGSGRGINILSGTLEIAGARFGGSNANALDVQGPGTLLISSDVNTTNTAVVVGGQATVIINAAAGANTGTGSSARRGYDIALGSTITGTGSIQGHNTLPSRVAGTFNPGSIAGAGTFTVINSGLELTSTSNFVVDLSPNPGVVGGGVNDLLVVNGEFGRLIIQDGAMLDINALTGDLGIGTYTLAQFPAGTLELAGAEGSGLTLGSIPAGYSAGDFQIIHDNDSGVLQLTVVPEPASLALLGLGGLLLLRRKR